MGTYYERKKEKMMQRKQDMKHPCRKCGALCFGTYCRKCFESKKGGKLSTRTAVIRYQKKKKK